MIIEPLLERSLNAVLTHDRNYLAHLRPLINRTIGFEVTEWALTFSLHFEPTHITVNSNIENVDLCLSANTLDFLAFALMKSTRQTLLQEHKVTFRGDLLLLEKLEVFFQSLDFDFPEAIKASCRWATPLKQSLKQGLKNQLEFQQEEAKNLISPGLYHHFVESLLILQQDTERLSARLASLSETSPSQ